MKKWSFAIVVVTTVVALLWFTPSAEAKKHRLPRLHGTVLLVSYLPSDLAVTTEDKTSIIQGGGEWYVAPSISADGRVIASARSVADDPPAARPRLIVGIYSMTDKRWTDYKDLVVFGDTVAISPDGSKLACAIRKVSGAPSHFRFLDLRTGKITVGPQSSDNAGPHLSWSPDGRYIAFDREVERRRNGELIPPLQAVFVLDIEAGTVSKIADGASPSWSPSGEWIAFYDYSPGRDIPDKRGRYDVGANRISLIRPDGTDSKVLHVFHWLENANGAPVWSPDSRTPLINDSQQESVNPKVNIHMLNIDTHKFRTKFWMTAPVYGWAAAQ